MASGKSYQHCGSQQLFFAEFQCLPTLCLRSTPVKYNSEQSLQGCQSRFYKPSIFWTLQNQVTMILSPISWTNRYANQYRKLGIPLYIFNSITYLYYMASSVSGQDESNPALWLATRAGKMELSCPLRITRRVPQEKFPRKPYNKSFID